MKPFHLILSLLLIGVFANAQTIFTTPQNYQILKQTGKLNPKTTYKFLNTGSANVSALQQNINTTKPSTNLSAAKTASNSSCQCMMPVNSTFTVVPMLLGLAPDYRNDDYSSASIPLGFNFCFYGVTYTSCYINNNGNVTFVNPLSGYSAGGFPAGNTSSLDTIIIAPFWADVDTRNLTSGLVYFKKTATALIVKWSNVGYYSSMADKVNDFQLIITSGNDPLLPNGNNVAFCYGDMQWTTGSASGGTGGFGGTPATVGVNKGDHTNFIQIGRFDKAGTSYDGPYGANDGISFLDYKSYFFNTCGTNNNLPPIIQDATGGGSACGDTIRICALGDTLVYTTSFLAPEGTQSVSVVGSAPTLGASFTPLGVTSTSGGVTTYAWMVVASASLTGVHTVIITGTDNGVPPLSTSATYYIKIQNIAIPQPTLSVSPGGTVCATPGATVTLTNCTAYDNVYWSNGSSGCSIIANTTGQYFVTVNKLGCFKSSSDSVKVFANPIPVVFGPLNYCSPATSTTLSLNPPTAGMVAYATYTWTTPATNTPTAALASGPKTITVTDINGCMGSVTFTVTSANPTVSITANPPSICGSGTTTLTASISGATSYSWSNGATTQTTTVTTGGVYGVTVTASSCVATKTINVVVYPTPTVTLPPTVGICSGVNAIVAPTPTLQIGTTYTWSTGSHASSLSVGTPTTLTLQITDVNGCISNVSNTCTVLVATNPTVSLSNTPIVFCNGTVASITSSVAGGSPAFSYSWSPASLGAASTATTGTVGTYTLLVTDQNLCKSTATVETLKSTPTVTLTSPDLIICPGECATLNASATSSFTPISYSWSNATPTFSTLQVCSVGTTTVIITDAKGCTATKNLTVVGDIIPVANFMASPLSPVTIGQVITFTNTSTIASGTIISSSWSFGDGSSSIVTNPSYAYASAGTFPITLIVTGSSGCKDTIVVKYSVDAVLIIPNVITPNGDGINDFLKFKNLEVFSSNTLTVFNRWGKKVYEQDLYKNDWSGGGHNDGTYFFILSVPEATPKVYQGFFQLMR